MRLLVVDDCSEFCELIQEFSELCSHQFGIRCEVVDSGQAAIAKIASWIPELVLVDAHLLEGSTLELRRLCREGQAPVVVTSDQMSLEIQSSATNWGAAGYLPKSLDPDEMELFLKRLSEYARTQSNV
jgi:DNA-binding response OmpR family regulator